jgi:hypothetical protein
LRISENDCVFKGSWAINNTPSGTGRGPSSVTGFYNGANIPTGGYAIYSPNGVYVASNDTELIGKVTSLGANVTGASGALTWAAGQSNHTVLNKSMDNIVTSGLVLNLDASHVSSFNDNQATVNVLPSANALLTSYNDHGGTHVTDATFPLFGNSTLRNTSNPAHDWNGVYLTGMSAILTPGVTYTYSFYIYFTSSNTSISYFGYGAPGFTGVQGQWNRVSTTFVATTQDYFYVTLQYSNGQPVTTYYLANLQIEAKSTATPFVNGTRSQNTTCYDLSGNSKNGTLTNGPVFNSNSTFDFDGNDDYISIPNPLNQPNLGQVWSVSALVKLNSGTSGPQYIIGPNGLNNGVAADWYNAGPLLYLNGGANDYYSYGSGYIGGTGWNHLTYLFNNSANLRQIYKNGILIGNGAGPNNTSTPSGIGATWNLGQMAGSISSLQVYNRVMSTAEIYQNYYGGPIVTSGLVFAVDAGNLVSYPRTGTTAYNLAGSNNLTLSNGLQYNAGNSGYFLSDGSDDGLVTPDASNLDLSTFTLEGFVWWNQHKNYGSLLVKGPGGTGHLFNYCFFFYAASLSFGFGDGNNFYNASISAPTINRWHHILGTYNGTVLKFYLNGVLQSENPVVATPYQNTSDLNVIQNAYPIDGRVATSRLYNRAFTADEVVQNFQAQRNRFGI